MNLRRTSPEQVLHLLLELGQDEGGHAPQVLPGAL